MKVLLWLLLLAALLFNLVSGLLWDGSVQALLSVGSGLICLTVAGFLWRIRVRERGGAPRSEAVS
ncbi:hypothetical protein [Streptomyces sp. NPDC014894]|uniref:hypothetical protein n=1 Tax=unclassified Streptomyces TaxID=2593676 RepID=UPI0036F9814A